ncbi:hypothetical protein BGW41_006160, partial [Actinomortierella wolfii]
TTYKPHTTYVPSHPASTSHSASSSPALSATHVAPSSPHVVGHTNVSPGLGPHSHSPAAHAPYPQQQQQYYHHHQQQQHHAGDTGRISPTPALPKPRPLSGGSYAPHPLMVPFAPGNLPTQSPGVNMHSGTAKPRPHSMQHTVIPPMYPPINPNQQHQNLPTQMPIPMQVHMPVPMPMPMPVPVVPQPSHSPNPQGMGDTATSVSSSPKRHSQPITVSFPGIHPTSSTASPPLPPKSTSPTPTPSSGAPVRRNPHAVLPPAQPGFRIPVGYDDYDDDAAAAVAGGSHDDYDGPPPDYAEAAMQPPAELLEEKEKKKQALGQS